MLTRKVVSDIMKKMKNSSCGYSVCLPEVWYTDVQQYFLTEGISDFVG